MSVPLTHVEVSFTTGPNDPAPVWVDVSSYVRHESGISIDRGRGDEGDEVGPSRLSLTFQNNDGRFTPGNTAGTYYPNIKKGRRIRVSSSILANGTFDTDTTGWSGSNATLARVTTPVQTGAGALRLTASSAADMSADTASGTSGMPVTAGAKYLVTGWFRTAVTARSCKMRVDWYTSGGVFISSEDTASVTDATGSWTRAEAKVTAPATSAFARIRAMVTAPANGEVHYLDDARLALHRFSGYIDDWRVTWPGLVSSFNTCAVTASSRLARLGSTVELKSIIEEEYLLDSPAAYYTLSEPEGATTADESSGNNEPNLKQTGTGAAVTFGTATGPSTDDLTAASFTGGKRLTTTLSTAPAVLECFFSTSVTPSAPVAVLSSDAALYVGTDGKLHTGSGVDLGAGSVVTDGAVRHVVWMSGAVYVDGVSIGSPTEAPSNAIIGVGGGGTAGAGTDVGTITGNISHVAAHASLTAARALAHADAGLDGFANETPAARLARYASYADVPSAETSFETGDVLNLAHIDTTGKTALACMREVEVTENGVLFDAADGTLTFHDRGHRYGATSAFTLVHDDGEIAAALEPVLDDQQLVNDLTATGSTGISARVKNDTSIDDYGPYRETLDLATSNAEEPLQAAGWRVNRYNEPGVRIPGADVYLNSADDTLRNQVLAADIGTRFTLSTLPSNAPASSMDMFIEGMTETITAVEHRVSFRTSPAEVFNVWLLGDATYGVLNTSTRLGY